LKDYRVGGVCKFIGAYKTYKSRGQEEHAYQNVLCYVYPLFCDQHVHKNGCGCDQTAEPGYHKRVPVYHLEENARDAPKRRANDHLDDCDPLFFIHDIEFSCLIKSDSL